MNELSYRSKNLKFISFIHSCDCDCAISITVDLLILARYRDRTVSVTKLWPQISHPYHTLSTVP